MSSSDSRSDSLTDSQSGDTGRKSARYGGRSGAHKGGETGTIHARNEHESCLEEVGWLTGLEPVTFGATIRCSCVGIWRVLLRPRLPVQQVRPQHGCRAGSGCGQRCSRERPAKAARSCANTADDCLGAPSRARTHDHTEPRRVTAAAESSIRAGCRWLVRQQRGGEEPPLTRPARTKRGGPRLCFPSPRVRPGAP